MKVTFIGKNIETTDALKNIIEKKLSKFDKHFDVEKEAKVVLSVQKKLQKIEITLMMNNICLRAEEMSSDMYKSIDEAIEKLERQIRKHKTKLAKKNSPSIKYPEVDDNIDEYDIGKVKKVPLEIMTCQDAIYQMELLEHPFFVYKDKESNKICVAYKRNEGDFGLLETV